MFPFAVGRSYFAPILPPGRVDLGWSSNALHWLSRNPVDVPDHGWAVFSASEQAREVVDRQLAEDWSDFLHARATELRIGARRVCQFMGRGPTDHGFEWMAGCFWQSLRDMEADGLLRADELLRITCPSAGRSIAQIEPPFENGVCAGLALRHRSVAEAPDPSWEAYSQSGDAGPLGRSWSLLMRAANGPNFAAALEKSRDPEAFLHALTERVAARVAADPQRSRSYNLLIALEKVANG